MSIPETVISEILNSVNIVDFIGHYVKLKSAGKNHVGLCPFHSEKTPSFSVSLEKQLFYCFGCGEGGNIFSFLMKYENLSFPEAAETIARQYGIRIPQSTKRISDRDNLRRKIFELNKYSSDYYNELLLSSGSGKKFREYLKSREIPDSVIEIYKLGAAPDGWDNLLSFLKKKGFSPDLCEKAGLVVGKKSGHGFYDRFRSRLIFPIFDIRGDINAFGGRILGSENPKYLNSPETPVYSKSRSLYGLKQASGHCRKENRVYIVEGYIDVLSLFKSGIKNCVASLGTALTSWHIKILKGFCEKMVLVYDGDQAGINAAIRSIDIFINEQVDADILILPDKMDPDDYIRQYGGDKFIEAGSSAKSAVDFLIDSFLSKYGSGLEGKIKVVGEFESILGKIPDPVAKALHVSNLSDKLGIPESAIFERINKGSGRHSFKVQQNKPSLSAGNISRLEISLVSALLDLPELKDEYLENGILDKISNGILKENLENILNNPFAVMNPEVQSLVAKNKLEQGSWNIKQAKILIKQFEYASRRKNLKL